MYLQKILISNWKTFISPHIEWYKLNSQSSRLSYAFLGRSWSQKALNGLFLMMDMFKFWTNRGKWDGFKEVVENAWAQNLIPKWESFLSVYVEWYKSIFASSHI